MINRLHGIRTNKDTLREERNFRISFLVFTLAAGAISAAAVIIC